MPTNHDARLTPAPAAPRRLWAGAPEPPRWRRLLPPPPLLLPLAFVLFALLTPVLLLADLLVHSRDREALHAAVALQAEQLKASQAEKEKPPASHPDPSGTPVPVEPPVRPPTSSGDGARKLAEAVTALEAAVKRLEQVNPSTPKPGSGTGSDSGVGPALTRFGGLLGTFDEKLDTSMKALDGRVQGLEQRLQNLQKVADEHFKHNAEQADVLVLALSSKFLNVRDFTDALRDLFQNQTFAQNYRNHRLALCVARGDEVTPIFKFTDDPANLDLRKLNQLPPPGQTTEALPDLGLAVVNQFPGKAGPRRCVVVASRHCPPPLAKEQDWNGLAVDAVLLATDPARRDDQVQGWAEFCGRHRGSLALVAPRAGTPADPKAVLAALASDLTYHLRRFVHPQLVKEK